MKHGKRIQYAGVLDIPEGTHGSVSIRHLHRPAGTTLQTWNGRCAMFGQKGGSVKFREATRWHELSEDEQGVWMTDLPIEQRQIDELIVGATGRVLVGGLGLGYVVVALARKPRVRSIVVIEKSRDVINLVWNATVERVTAFREKGCTLQVVCDDIQHYADAVLRGQFDWAFFDTWQSDNETTFHRIVAPLLAATRSKIPVIRCWNEDIMRGQLFNGIRSRLMMIRMVRDVPPDAPEAFLPTITTMREQIDLDRLSTPDGTCWIDWAAPFWAWYRDARPADDVAERAAGFYAQQCGRASSERIVAALRVGWADTCAAAQ